MIGLKRVSLHALGAVSVVAAQPDPSKSQYLQKRSGEEVNLATLTYGNILLRAPTCFIGNSTQCMKHAINDTLATFFHIGPAYHEGNYFSTFDNYSVAFSWTTFDYAEKAFAAFENTTERLATLVDVVVDFVFQNRSSELCIDLYGSGGLLNHGVMTISIDGDLPYPTRKHIDERLQPPYADCGLGNLYMHGNNVLVKGL